MIRSIATVLLALAAFANAQDASTHPYVAPGTGDVRSPCPGLNSLANHGYLPHNGKNISLGDFVTGLKNGLNVGSDFSIAVGGLGLQASPNPLLGTVNLDDLQEYNFPIQHDASLSRLDYPNDALHFNQQRWDGITSYFTTQTISFAQASKARYNRVKECQTQQTHCIYGPRQLVLSYGETALYLSTMGNPTTGNPRVDYVQTFFEKERLPFELGWTKPAQETNLITLGGMIGQLFQANPEKLPEGLSLGAGTLQDVYQLKDPISGELVNATCALIGKC